MTAIADQLDVLTSLLRSVAAAHPEPLPRELAIWWQSEQQRIVEEQAERDARRTARRADLRSKIAALQAELDALR